MIGWKLASLLLVVVAIADFAALEFLYPMRDLASQTVTEHHARHREHLLLLRLCRGRRDVTNQTQAALLETQALMTKVLQGLQTNAGGWRDETTQRLERLEACACPPTTTTLPDGS